MKSLLEEKPTKILCETCLSWVQCGKDDKGNLKGFCLLKPLFEYTFKTSCNEYFEDESLVED